MSTNKIALPIDDYLDSIWELLQSQQNIVLTAAPGAGKTTRLPSFLSQKFSKKTFCLEPRRMAAVAAASRVAEENNWSLGQEVGYQVRFANETTSKTKLIFLTEALLNRKIIQDPELKEADLVILDEFHERSLHVDLALGMIRELQLLGSPLKLVVMSATLEAEKISKYLGDAPIIQVPGKLFELNIQYQKSAQSLQTQDKFYEDIFQQLKITVQNSMAHDILIFLPGVGEIERLSHKINSWCESQGRQLYKLHGSLSLEDQKRVLKPSEKLRVILSTNIAESSVTLDGVNVVIDTGLSKTQRWDTRTGFSRLELGRISLSSATQRAGRAARQMPGFCYRMWNRQDELSMPKDDIPEILKVELSEALLFLAGQGITDFKNFLWFENPLEVTIQRSLQFLKTTHLIDNENRITSLGSEILHWPLPPREALLLKASQNLGQMLLGAQLSAVIQEKDFLLKGAFNELIGDKWECDLSPRIEILNHHIKISDHILHRGSLAQVKKSIDQLMRLEKKPNQTLMNPTNSTDLLRQLLLTSFTDRICRRRSLGSEKGVMIGGGRGVVLSNESLVKNSEFFVAIRGVESDQSKETQISWACGFEKDFILEIFKNEIRREKKLVFNSERKVFYIEESRYLQDLALDSPTQSLPKAEDMENLLPEWCLENIEYIINEHAGLKSWMNRWSAFSQQRSEAFQIPWKEVFQNACYGESQISSLLEKDLCYYTEAPIPAEFLNSFKTEFPAKIQVPSQQWIQIHYPLDKGPYIEVRLQEIFGWFDTPIIGSQKLTLHLLGPNYRAVQVTQDLKSFWNNAYQEIRKELKIKYPKHSWPEDPLTAIAVAKGPSQKR